MDQEAVQTAVDVDRRLLATLERLLQIEATEVKAALNQASQLVVEALAADKVDIFLYDPAIDSLVAMGTSNTPLGQRERAVGMDRLPLVNGGRAAEVFQTGIAYRTGHADQDPVELVGITRGLGVRSTLCVALDVNSERRGVLEVTAVEAERFSAADLGFLQAIASWVGLVLHRAELIERIAQDADEQARRVATDEIITILAHDLGNYLTPLIGRIYILRSRAARDGRSSDTKDLEAISQGLERLRRLIADLLDTARLEQGIFDLALQPVDLAALAQETVNALRTAETSIDVRGPDELVVEADPGRLRQALENLLSNALKHTPSGVPVVVELSTESRGDRAWAALTVRDAGPGIPPELLPRLFTRFASGPNSQGLGLGLYLARGIAEAHAGMLTVESTSGRGTTFCLSLPIPEELRSNPGP